MVMMLFLLAYLMFTILSMVHEYAYMLWIYLEIGLLTQMRFVILSLLNEYDDVLVEIMLFKVCNVQFIDKLTHPNRSKETTKSQHYHAGIISCRLSRPAWRQWRSYYGANGASAPPGPPRVTYTIRANPLFFCGEGLAIEMQLGAL